MEWLPIETVPHDRFVLVYAANDTETKQFVGKFIMIGIGGYRVFKANDKWEFPINLDDKPMPIKEIAIVCKATHWAPLLDAPVLEEGK